MNWRSPNVQAENVSDSSVAGFSADFDYRRFSLRTFDAITGKLTGVTGWDRVAELASTKSVSVAPSTGNAEAQATDYVFAATGIKGESQIRVSPGFSDITGFSFGVSQPTLEGVSQGDSEPSTLTLTFATDTALPDLLLNMTQGKIMDNASLLGLANIGGDKGLQKVFSIDLARVLVTAVNDFAGAGFSVDLDFVKFGITQTKINPLTAQLGGKNTFGWDDVLDQPAVVAGLTLGTKEQAVVPTSYVMAIDGFHGDLASVARGGWIEIAGMDFGGTNPTETEAGGGISGSKFDLNSITISVESDSGLTALLDYMTKGTPISGIQIEGSALDGANVEKTVQAYTLGEVYVASVVDREGPGYFVTLEAARFELLNFKLNGLPIGNPVGWNLETGKTGGPGVIVSPGGSAGNDVLAGNRNANLIDGLLGNDAIYGYDGFDTLLGNDGKDRLFGGNGDDTLSGGIDNDILTGGAGKDTLTGGGGIDRFTYTAASESRPGTGRDIITDFFDGVDRIDLDDVTLPGVVFVGQGAFTGTNQIQVATSGFDTVVRVNMAGDLTPDLEILVQNTSAANFSLADFVV